MVIISPKICIIGCGTYGTYLAKRLVETLGKNAQITVVEIGNEKIKDEKEMGVEAESPASSAAQNGRYFGLGGTSARWGGQVLFFDKRDNPANDSDWNTIIDINERYKHAVIKNLLGNTKALDKLGNDKADLKTGIWLKYSRRNIYKLLDKNTLASVRILKNKRVTDFIFKNKTIHAVKCTDTEGVEEIIEADIFYLTAGAIESCRLMLDINERHNVLINNDLGKHYGDHLSVELFRITNHLPNIEGKDLLPRFMNGSLITKRLIEVAGNGQVGFAHPIINKEVQVFTAIKKILFGKQENKFNLKEVLVGIEFLVRFGFNALILKKMYVHRKTWSLQLEMEQAFPNANHISLSDKIDKYGQKAARLNWSVSQEDKNAIEDIKTSLSQWLKSNGVEFSVVYEPNIAAAKIEDVYHPAGFMRLGQDEKAVLDYDCRVKGIENLFHFSTAMFPSAKSINPTGAGFCFVEHHVDTFFNKK